MCVACNHENQKYHRYLSVATLQANILTTNRITGEIIRATSVAEVCITLTHGQEAWALLCHTLRFATTSGEPVLT
jgi:hypothetical protein